VLSSWNGLPAGGIVAGLLLLSSGGCERGTEMWVPGAKPTAYSGAVAAPSRPVAAPSRPKHPTGGIASGSGEEAGPESIEADAVVEGPLKEQLALIRGALRLSDQRAIDDALQRCRALDQGAVQRVLIRILKANEDDLGVAAARALGKLKIRAGLRSLYDRILSEDIFLAQAAAEALGDLGDPGAVPQLISQAKRHASASVRSAAVEAVGRIGDRSALSAVLEGVQDPDPTVRESVARVIGRLGQPQEHHLLLTPLLQDPAPRVRLAAVLALAELRAPEALDSLVGLLADSSEEVRRTVEAALVSFPDRLAVRRKLMESLESGDGAFLLSYSQALKTVCDCSCLPDVKRIGENSSKPVTRNACNALYQQLQAGCP